MRDLLARTSLRTRITLLATVLAALVLGLAGWVLVAAVRDALADEVAAAAAVRSRDLASLAAADRLPDPVAIGDADEALVQVVRDGEVVGGSANALDGPPLDVEAPADGSTVVVRRRAVAGLETDDAGGFVVAATRSTTADVTVLVVASLEDATEGAATAARLGLATLPVLVVVLGLGVWVLVGRTLRPVEAIRAEAESIGGGDLDRRVPEPPARDEVGSLARTINGMLGRLEESSARERRFVGDAAHELRTPVASIRANLETARASAAPVDWDVVSRDVLAAAVRMQRLTEQLLLLARADAGRLAERMHTVDLDDVVERVVASHTVGAGPEVTADVAPVQVEGDPVLLELAVGELVENARAHARSRVVVSCARDGVDAIVRVDDDGPGVPVAERARVLERFARLDEARSATVGGAGLGLSIVADVAAAHRGSVLVTDGPSGARVVIRLPASASA